jgi:uncharacterized protein (DUF1501 family)
MAFNAKVSRRSFMVGCSATIAAMAGSRITHLAFASPDAPDATNGEVVVVVFLRGGVDGINVIPPTGGSSNDRAHYEAELRKNLKIPASGANSALGIGSLTNPATGQTTSFGMNPALAPLHGLYQSGFLAVVHATGLTSSNRSHFDSMQFMETGTPDVKTTGSGWLARHLNTLNMGVAQFPALSAGSGLAMSLGGRQDAIALTSPGSLNLYTWGAYADQQKQALRDMYSLDASDPNRTWIHSAGENALNALDIVGTGNYTPAPGVTYPQYSGFSESLKTVAQMIKMDVGLRAATLDLGGWDTHENQQYPWDKNGVGGYFYDQLSLLARGLMSFFQDLGQHTKRTTIIVMSEFGRTLKENANNGTDHGHGNVLLVLGGGINGGRVYGAWPGLAGDQLFDGRDLQITTDYRHVLSELLVTRLGNTAANLPTIFPNGYTPPAQWMGIAREPARTFTFAVTYLPVAMKETK